PSFATPSATVWIVSGRWPASVAIWRRVRTSLTGRPTTFAAAAASRLCCQVNPFDPNAPPTNGATTRTLSGGNPNTPATTFRVAWTHREESCSVSASPRHSATVAAGSTGWWCSTGVRYVASTLTAAPPSAFAASPRSYWSSSRPANDSGSNPPARAGPRVG